MIHNIHIDCHILVNPTLNRLQSIPLFGHAGYVLLQENYIHCEVCAPKPEPYTTCLEIDPYFLLFIQVVIWYTNHCKVLSKFNTGKHLVKYIWYGRSKSIIVHVPHSVSFLFQRIRNVTLDNSLRGWSLICFSWQANYSGISTWFLPLIFSQNRNQSKPVHVYFNSVECIYFFE